VKTINFAVLFVYRLAVVVEKIRQTDISEKQKTKR
jgi:hypothetical protein